MGNCRIDEVIQSSGLQQLCVVKAIVWCGLRYSRVVGKREVVEVELAVLAIVTPVTRNLRSLQSCI